MSTKRSAFFHFRLVSSLVIFVIAISPFRMPLYSVTLATSSIYADSLAGGWQNWSWDTTSDPAVVTPVHTGANSFSVKYNAAWAGFYLHADPAISTAGVTHLRFWIHGGATGGQQIKIVLNGNGAQTVAVTASANAWKQIDTPLSSLGSPATISDIYWQDATGTVQTIYYLDDIELVNLTAGATATPTPVSTPNGNIDITLNVDLNANRHPISDLVYGIHYASDTSFADEIDLPVRRFGGNDTSRYNWKNNMFGNPDWYFENERRGESADQFVLKNQASNTDSIITIPMIGYVAKDPGQVGNSATYQCSFDTRKYTYTPQPYRGLPGTDPSDPNRAHCGNGVTGFQNGNAIYLTGNDPLDTSIAIDPNWASEWITHLQTQHGTAENGGVRFYSLDNEPDIWFETHRDVAPNGLTMQKLRNDSIAYASAIKAADPNAQVVGLVVNGWTYYWNSPADGKLQAWDARPDRKANGDIPLVPWFLKEMATYEAQHSTRLLDYLDLHYYVQSPGISQSNAGDAASQARRLRSTRSLWDPTYTDESWIATAPVSDENGQVVDYDKVRLIPRMREWVVANYPGTKLAITEYNWGALDHINGALAQADVLGIFGREGMDMALLFDSPYSPGGKFTAGGPGAYAFRIYRNYDGQKSKFGDIGVQASSSDQGKLAVYAAQRSNDGSLTLVVINKTGGALTADLSVANLGNAEFGVRNAESTATTIPHSASRIRNSASAEIYRYSPANLNAIVRQPDQPISGGGFVASYPANSITLIRIASAAGATPVSTPTATATLKPGETPLPTSTPNATTVPNPTPTPTRNERIYLPVVAR